MPSFVHILNPVKAKSGSDMEWIQNLTFASISEALKQKDDNITVNVVAAAFPEDMEIVPDWMAKGEPLTRSITDYTGKPGRKLPLLSDVLHNADGLAEFDYVVFSNLDICLMPQFYNAINYYVSKGLDAFAINRRRIRDRYRSPHELELMYSEAGEKHPGYDMLIFKKTLLKKFQLGNVCVGVPFFDTVLIHNFYAFADNFRLLTGKHLTFHVGMELIKQWGNSVESEHNKTEYRKVRKSLYPNFKIENFPGSDLSFFKRHFKWLFNPTFHYPTMFKLDLSQLNHKRKRKEFNNAVDSGSAYQEFMVRRINFDDEF